MIPDSAEPAPLLRRPIQVAQAPALQNQPPAPAPAILSAEEIRAIETVFSQKQEAPAPGAGLLGFWAAGLLAQDLGQPAAPAAEEDDKVKRPSD